VSDIKWTLEPDDIEWTMPWDQTQFPDKPATEQVFESERALAHLLMNHVIAINSNWWRDDAPEDIRNSIAVFVNCNDIFAWGCADAEDLPHNEVEKLYRMWQKDPAWGAAIWCIQQRNQQPQRPVAERIRQAGIWDLDSMGLKPNGYDEYLKKRAAEKAASPS
jgi:hypothetical protein